MATLLIPDLFVFSATALCSDFPLYGRNVSKIYTIFLCNANVLQLILRGKIQIHIHCFSGSNITKLCTYSIALNNNQHCTWLVQAQYELISRDIK